MSNAFSRSWEITKLSIDVMRKDKELLLFPLCSGIFSILFMVALLFPTLVMNFLYGNDVLGIMAYLFLFLTYLGLAFIATFFNVCVVYTAKKRFEGGNATFMESIKFAFSRIHLIFTWSLLAATVGLLLKLLDDAAERMGPVGQIVVGILVSILGMAWAIITLFVVPAMVYHELGPIDAIKKSVQTVKKTWGESLIRHFGLGMIQGLFFVIGLVIAAGLILLAIPMGAGAIVVAVILIVIYYLLLFLFFSVANSIFNTALYVYAEEGIVPGGYNKDVMQNAFKEKPKGKLAGLKI